MAQRDVIVVGTLAAGVEALLGFVKLLPANRFYQNEKVAVTAPVSKQGRCFFSAFFI
jgi:hypothetical protein